jgi:hypothetical protein
MYTGNNFVYVFKNNIPRCGRSLHLYVLFITDQYQKKILGRLYWSANAVEAQIQVPRCNSILKAGSHECQKLRPLHLYRCTGEHTDHSSKATHLNVCVLSSVWARSCFWIPAFRAEYTYLPICFDSAHVLYLSCNFNRK